MDFRIPDIEAVCEGLNRIAPAAKWEMEMTKPTSKPFGLVTTVGGSCFPEDDWDKYSRSGKLSPKPDDTHRKHLSQRAKEHVALVNKIVPDRLKKTPSQKKSESMKKRLRNRDGYKVTVDFKEPEVVK